MYLEELGIYWVYIFDPGTKEDPFYGKEAEKHPKVILESNLNELYF